MGELVSASFNSPVDVFVFFCLDNVESLSQSSQLLGVRLLSCLAQIMLIVRNQFFDSFLCISAINTMVLRAIGRKSKQCVDEHLSAIFSFHTIWEQVSSPLNKVESDFLDETFVCFLAEALHDIAEFKGTASVNFIVSSLYEHLVESASRSLWFQLGGRPFKLADLLE